MKIELDNNSKMILRDNNTGRFLSGLGLVSAGLGTACLFGNDLLPSLLALALVVVGGYILHTTKRVHIELDMASARIKIRLRGFAQTEDREIAFCDVEKVVLSKLIKTSFAPPSIRGSGAARTYYQFRLVLMAGRNKELSFDFGRLNARLSNLIASPDNRKQDEAQQIADFIGAPLEVIVPSSGAVVAAVWDDMLGRSKVSI
jgi:hypothetical protein